MTEQRKVEYEQLEVGYEFPPASFDLDAAMVSAYLKATGETDGLYQDSGIIPPPAVAAWALASLLEFVSLPFGTIHLSQEVQCLGLVHAGDTITCHAKVSRKQERSRLKLLNIDISVVNQDQVQVLSGKSSFNLP